MFKKYFSVLLFIYYFFIISVSPVQSLNGTTFWESFTQYMKVWGQDFSTKNRFIFEKILKRSSNVTQNCSQSIFSTFEAIERLENWSVEMINSWANFPPTGIYLKKKNCYFILCQVV